MRRALVPPLLGLLLWAAPASAAEPVLERVLLSTGGVGYLGWRAEVGAEDRLALTVPLAQVDDVLKSLTVFGEGAVGAVSLAGPAPLADLFRDVPFGEADLASLPALLASLRGAEVEVRGRSAMRGRLIAVTPEEVKEGEERRQRHRLSLATAEGLRHAILEETEAVALESPELRGKLELVLARLADGRLDRERELRVALPGAAGRTVRFGYLAEMPLWKASYRLVAGEAEGLLQGWAIFENLSGQNWRGVEVTLAAGSPTALRQALFQSYFVPRPEVPVLPEPGLPRPAPAPLAASEGEPLAAARADSFAAAAPTALEEADTRELTAQTLFRLAEPITLPSGHTAMAPLVDRRVPIERVVRHRAGPAGPHPEAALRLRNGSESSLPAGVATLYEELPGGGLTYLGDARLPALPPGAEELVGYGLDGNVTVDRREDRTDRVVRGRIVDGVLELARTEQRRAAYAVTARFAGAPRTFVLEEPVPPGWRVAEPADARIVDGFARVERSLPPQSTLDLAVVLERPLTERIELAEIEPDRLLLLLEGPAASPELRTALARLQELSGAVAELERRIAAAETRRAERVAEQERLRANLAAVPPESDLARRYLDRLGRSEDELSALAGELDRLRAELDQAEEARRAYLRGLRA